MTDSIHFRSDRDDWETPQDLFDALNAEFGFTVDVCATEQTAKCARYYTKADNGLAQDWSNETVWMNPPFGHVTKLWMDKARLSSLSGATVVCLVPARVSVLWWHRNVLLASEVRCIRPRLQFVGAAQKAPFDAVLVVFRQGDTQAKLMAYNLPGARKLKPATVDSVAGRRRMLVEKKQPEGA